MKKSEAQLALVSDQVDRLGYSGKKDWSSYKLEQVEACFELSRIGKTYYPSLIKSLTQTVMRFEVQSWHDEEDKEELERVKQRLIYFCESRDINYKN